MAHRGINGEGLRIDLGSCCHKPISHYSADLYPVRAQTLLHYLLILGDYQLSVILLLQDAIC